MVAAADIASYAALLADPSRAAMLTALMDGRALTATELAAEGGIAASTASSHLSRLVDAGLLGMVRQGRHRYFRLADDDVAAMLEDLMRRLRPAPGSGPRTGPADAALRHARVCYDHLAGACGTRLFAALRARGYVAMHEEAVALTATGETWCRQIGIDLDALRARRRPLCRPCLDWSERRPHLAGALGAALFEHLLARGGLRRQTQGRALTVTSAGRAFLDRLDPRG